MTLISRLNKCSNSLTLTEPREGELGENWSYNPVEIFPLCFGNSCENWIFLLRFRYMVMVKAFCTTLEMSFINHQMQPPPQSWLDSRRKTIFLMWLNHFHYVESFSLCWNFHSSTLISGKFIARQLHKLHHSFYTSRRNGQTMVYLLWQMYVIGGALWRHHMAHKFLNI